MSTNKPKRPSRFERPFALLRKQRGLSLDQAAIRLGISPRYLRSLELAHGPLSMVLAQRMAAVYQTTVNNLVAPISTKGPAGQGG